MKRTVLTMLQNAAERYRDRPYVMGKTEEGWQGRSYLQAREGARAFAAALLERGMHRRESLAVLAHGSPNWVVGELGILSAGCVSVPLSVQLLPEEIPFRLNHSEARGVLVSRHTVEKLFSVLDQIERKDFLVIYLEADAADVEAAFREAGLERGKNLFLFDDLLREGERVIRDHPTALDEREEQVEETDVVTISYTSGTTGNPKGIMLTHCNYYVNCADSVTMFDIPEDYSTLVILPCDHSFAHTVALYASLLKGICLYFVDSRGGSTGILRSISPNLLETNPTLLLTVPALSGNFMKKIREGIREKGRAAEALFNLGMKAGIRFHADGFHQPSLLTRAVSHPVYRLVDALVFRKVRSMFGSRIEFCVGGGALLDIKQQQFFKSLGIPIYQGYGLTEAAPVISSNTPRAHKLGSSGRLLPSVECRIVKSDGRKAAIGETGEIVIRGENVMKGYFKNEKATAEAIRGGWLFTGDLGYTDEDDFLVVVGREKALLIGEDGEKYSPEEIEEAIVTSSELISQVMLHNDHCRYTTALAVLDQDAVKRLLPDLGGSADALLEAVRDSFFAFQRQEAFRNRFPRRWLPATFQILQDGFTLSNRLMNSTMKIVRYRITETYRELLDYMYTAQGDRPDNPRNAAVLRELFFGGSG